MKITRNWQRQLAVFLLAVIWVLVGICPQLVDASTPSNMVLVEGGTFQMGDALGERDEKPVHSVTVRSFYIGKYEVTFDEYDEFCNATGLIKPSDEGWGRGQHPVMNVSWYDAVEYCNWRSSKEGLVPVYVSSGNNVACDFTANGYRLPTEAEWEYAAKGGNQSEGYQYSGSDNANDVAWYDDNAGSRTHLVGQKLANEIGIYDMSGNVHEWCWDWYDRYKYKISDTANPLGPPSGSKRIFRGGSWYFDAKYVRSAYRHAIGSPSNSAYIVGFRIVRTCLQ